MKVAFQLAIACFVALIIAGCAGSEDSGSLDSSATAVSGEVKSTDAITVGGENKSTVAKTSSIGADKAIQSDTAPRFLTQHGVRSMLDGTRAHITERVERGLNRTVQTVDLSSTVCSAGGSASYEIDTGNVGSQSGTYTITYSNCASSFGGVTTTIDGTAEYTFSEDGSFTYSYDMTTTYDGETFTLSGTMTCDSSLDCTYEEDFSTNGVNYRVSNVSVSGNSSSGFDVTARVYHEELGYVDIEGDNLITCDSSGFSSGTITVTDSSSAVVITISFVSCTEMTVTFNGSSETVAQ